MVELIEVSKRYNGRAVLAPTTLRLAPGKTTALVGTSGAGKSTLLRLINGLVTPDTGHVLFDGVALSGDNLMRLRHRMGYVIQEGGLFPHLTARDNVTLLARELAWTPDAIAARLGELRNLMRLDERLLEQYPVELSGGQRQRVGLMRALFLRPDLLLLDEPLAALDPVTRAELQSELRELFGRLATTTVLVTHDIVEAALLADTLVVMHAGAVVQTGAFREVAAHPASDFVARFVNSPVKAAQQLAAVRS